MKKVFIIFYFIVFILIAIIIFSLLNRPNAPKKIPLITPTPTISPIQKTTTQNNNPESPVSDNFYRTPQEKQRDNKMSFVTSLIGHLPYNGKFFTLDYNFNNATFVLTLNKNSLTEANNEFDAYLKTNGINDRSLFENLITTYR